MFTGNRTTSNIDQAWTVTDVEIASGVPAMTFTGSALTFIKDSSSGNPEGIVNNDNNTQTFSNSEIIFGQSGAYDITATGADIDINAKITISGAETLNVGGANDVFFDGGIVGGATVNKSGAGELRLRDNSTGITNLNISGGQVLLSQTNNPTIAEGMNVDVSTGATFNMNGNTRNIDRLSGTGSVSMGSGTLTFGDTVNFTWGGVISGSGGVILDKTAVATISGSQSYTGSTQITGGTLRLSGSGRLSNSTDVSVSSGATFDLNGISDTVDSISGTGSILLGSGILTVDETSGTRTFSGNITESGELQKNGGHTLVLTGSNTFTLLDINGGTVRASSQSNLGSGTIELSTGTLNTTATFTNSHAINNNTSNATIDVNGGTTLTQSGAISGGFGITKDGNGSLVYSGNNSYSGDTNIDDGTLRLGSSNRISNSSDVIIAAGATFDLDNRIDTVRSLSGNGTLDTGGTSGRLTVNAPSGTFTWSGISTGTGGFTKSGNHTLNVTNAQFHSGSTNINDGVLRLSGSGEFSSASDISVATGATWDLNGQSDLVDSIAGGGAITLGGGNLFVDENSASTRTFSGVISEAGNLTKSGSHVLHLSGNNTYTGTTTLDGGILRISSSSNLGSGNLIFDSGSLNSTASMTNSRTVTVNAGDSANFDVNTGTTFTQTGTVVNGSTSTLVKLGGGTFALNSSSGGNFTGDISVQAGTLRFGSGDTVANQTDVTVQTGATFAITQTEGIDGLSGSGSVTLSSGQLLEVGLDNGTTTFNGVISGSGSRFSKAGTGTQTLGASNTYTGTTTINTGTLRLSGAGRLSNSTDVTVNAAGTFDLNGVSDAVDSLNGSGSVTLGGGTLTVGSNNGGGTFSGNISESGSFAKVGAGTQTLSGINSWNAGTEIDGGTLRIATSSNLGSGGISIDGATLEVSGSFTNFRSITLEAGGGTIDVNAGQTLTHGAGTPLSGAGDFTKTDGGTFQIAGFATYGGDTFLNGGTLRLTSFGDLPDTTNVSIASGAIWDLNTESDTVQSISGGGTIQLGSGTLTVTQDGGSRVFSGAILEGGGLIKNGTHTLTLSGLNDYKGNTTINEGILSISEDFHLGDPSPAGNIVFGGGTLRITDNAVTLAAGRDIALNAAGGTIRISDDGGVALTVPGVISGVGGITINADNEEQATFSGVNTYSGGTRLEDSVLNVSQNSNLGANSSDLTLDGGILITNASFTNQHAIVLDGFGSMIVDAGTLTQSAGISGTGNLSLGGAPGTTMILTESATHAGNTSISSNLTLRFGSGELPDAFDVTASGVWDLNGVSDTIDGLFGSGTVQLGGGTLTVGSAGGDGNYTGAITEAGNFTKIGTGTQILSGANTYTGTTTIDGEGVLEITSNASLGNVTSDLVFGIGTLRTTSTFTTGRTTFINTIGQFETTAGTMLTFTSPINGDANADLVKLGDGTLELTQANDYGGLTEIQQGTLRLTGGGLLPSVGVDVFTGATLDMTDITDTVGRLLGGGDVLLGQGTLSVGDDGSGGTFSGVISGDIANNAGTLIKVGAGTQTLSGVNLYAGGTEVNGGTLRISADANLGAAGSEVSFDGGTLNTTADFSTVRLMSVGAGDGTIEVDDATTLQAGGSISGAGALNKTGDGTLVLTGVSSYLAGTNITGGVLSAPFDFNLGANTGQLTLDGGTLNTTNFFNTNRLTTLGAGGGTFDVDGITTLTHSGIVQGVGNLTKQGDGLLSLTTANTYTGNTNVRGGTVRVNASNRLGVETSSILLDNGTLHSTASFANNRIIFLGVDGGTIDVDGGNSITQFGQIRNSSVDPGSLTKAGGGTLTLAAGNIYTGPTNINSGIVRLNQDHALDNETDVDVAAGATFDVNNMTDSIDALSGSGDVLLGSGNLVVGANDGSGTFAGVISGTAC